MSTPPSIVLIQSQEAGNTAIGTGFIIHHAGEHSYILTCAHVVRDVGGAGQVLAATLPAEQIVIGEDSGLDLAVLRVARLAGRPTLSLRAGGKTGQTVSIQGYSKYIQYRPLETLNGRTTQLFLLSDSQQQRFADAWSITIDEQQKLLGGHSGSPVCDADGAVIGVMITSEGAQQGRAISVEALHHIWPEMPSGLVGAGPDPVVAPAQAPPAPPSAIAPLQMRGALIDFGRGNTIRDINIGKVAGHDMLNAASPAPSDNRPQPEHINVYLAAHAGLKGKAFRNEGELMLDWARDFLDGNPPPELWERVLVPDLQRLQDTCRSEGKRLIKLRAFACNTAALAFGHIFNQRAGFHIHYSDNRNALWRTDEPTRVDSPLVRTNTRLSPTGHDLILDLAVTTPARNVSEPVDAWLEEPNPSTALAEPPANQINRSRLRQTLIDLFNDGELRDLCFDLGIDYERLPGQLKSDKARELIGYAERTSRSAELIATCRALRPHGDWEGTPRQTVTRTTSVRQRIMLVREDQRNDLTPAEGAAIARQVCDLVGQEGKLDGTVHLFGALPMGVALLIGWGLKAGKKIQYYDMNGKRYQPTYLLQT